MVKKLALSLAALVLSLAVAELFVRVSGAAPKVYPIQRGRFRLSSNPKLGYEPAPVSYQGSEKAFYDYLGASNHLGFRDVEHALDKPPGTYRIVVLGDSIAAGLHVERFEDTFPPILQELLRAQGLPAEVISLAVSGYNTQQEVEMLKARGLAYDPDLVLLAYSLSAREHVDGDILKTLIEDARKKGGIPHARANPWLVESALYRLVRYRVLAPREPVAGDPQKYLDMVSGDTVAEYFGVLRDLAKAHGFDVLVAVFPRFAHNFHAYPFAAKHELARQLAAGNGFHYLDLIDPLNACRDRSPEPIEVDPFHPSAYGHRCAAEALSHAILTEIRPAHR